MKYNILVFGASENIFKTMKKNINYESVEIVGFLDNDANRVGMLYEGLEVYCVDALDSLVFDYIIVGALYAFDEIYKQLVSEKYIKCNRIFPLMSRGVSAYIMGEGYEFDVDVMEKLFRTEVRCKEEIRKMDEINSEYSKMNRISDNYKQRSSFYRNHLLIAHACGGYLKGEKREYTNSLEAFEESLKNGFDMFEVDVWGKNGNEIVCGSRLYMQYPVDIDYTILTLNNMFRILSKKIHSMKKVILDIKWNTTQDCIRMLNEIEEMIIREFPNDCRIVKDKIIIEVFDEVTAEYARSREWEIILTDYRNKDGQWFKKMAILCCKYDIPYMMIGSDMVIAKWRYLKYLYEKNIGIVAYTTDKPDQISSLKKLGVSSILTNYLRPL